MTMPNFHQLLYQILAKLNFVETLLKSLFTDQLRPNIRYQNLNIPKISLKVKQYLLDLYSANILQCQNLIQRDLKSWLVESAV